MYALMNIGPLRPSPLEHHRNNPILPALPQKARGVPKHGGSFPRNEKPNLQDADLQGRGADKHKVGEVDN